MIHGGFTAQQRRIERRAGAPRLNTPSSLNIQEAEIAAAVRLAITLEAKDAKRVMALFKRLLPKDLVALEAEIGFSVSVRMLW